MSHVMQLTRAEVVELSGHVGLLVMVHLHQAAERSEANTVCLYTVGFFLLNFPFGWNSRFWHSRGVPHGEVYVAVWQHADEPHGGLHLVPEGNKLFRVVGQAHAVPLPCKLDTNTLR